MQEQLILLRVIQTLPGMSLTITNMIGHFDQGLEDMPMIGKRWETKAYNPAERIYPRLRWGEANRKINVSKRHRLLIDDWSSQINLYHPLRFTFLNRASNKATDITMETACFCVRAHSWIHDFIDYLVEPFTILPLQDIWIQSSIISWKELDTR